MTERGEGAIGSAESAGPTRRWIDVVFVVLVVLVVLAPTVGAASAPAVDTARPMTGRTLAAGSGTRITAGNGHTGALTAVGGVRCWGANDWGQLGDGTFDATDAPA